jgi:hypothetical protein
MRQIAGAFSQHGKARLVQRLRAARVRKSETVRKRIEHRKVYRGHQTAVLDVIQEIQTARPDALSDELSIRAFATITGKKIAANQVRRLLSKL